ncbi:MAG: threonylcarbamoyl-AMP synthase [Alphaproteobacteria bacterium]|nr:threonylcarbamoyl-AMP synthase [Alphaproteobacteria bacterium]
MEFVNSECLDRVVFVLNNGGLVAFPTETVYGLGGNAYDDKVVAKIFECKSRPQFNPISVCYRDLKQAESDVEINDLAILFAEYFLPGAVTLILKRKISSKISWLCSAGKETIGIRVPNNDVALNLLKRLDFPLAAPSANRSADLSTTSPKEVSKSLQNIDDLLIIDGGECPLGIESTIVDLSENNVKILRQGAVSIEEISDRCKITPTLCETNVVKHYCTQKPIIMNCKKITKNDALLAFGKPIPYSRHCLNLSPSRDLTEAAQNLFAMLRQLDSTDAERICVMDIPNRGIGIAINDRLKRSI